MWKALQPTAQQISDIPFEDVEIAGDKVSYKIALKSEIFYRYRIFKAQVARLRSNWYGSLSDLIDKHVLTNAS